MSHQRKEIREAVKALLTGNTDAGANVFTNRAIPLWDVGTPSILVFALNETSQRFQTSTDKLKRILTLAVEARVKLPQDGDLVTDLDDKLDDLALSIETQINSDKNLGGFADDVKLIGTEIDLFAEGEMPMAALRLTYEVLYIF